MTTTLGLEMFSATIAIQGQLDQAGATRLSEMVVQWIGMTTTVKGERLRPCTWMFPFHNTGGTGATHIQPCLTHIQPLVESYTGVLQPGVVGVDTWQEHDAFFLIINSCRYFPMGKLLRKLRKHGWKVIDHDTCYASLEPRSKSWLRRKFNL